MKDILKLVITLSLATIISIFFKTMDISEANIVTVFILGVLVTSRVTRGYAYGIVASILGVVLFNFFFTEPYYSLMVYRKDYPITFLIMFTSALITSTTTVRIKREYQKSLDREKRINMLYKNSKELLEAKDISDMVDLTGKNLSQLLETSVSINYKYKDQEIEGFFGENAEENFIEKSEIEVKNHCFRTKKSSGKGTLFYPKAKSYYMPIFGKDEMRGTLGIYVVKEGEIIEDFKTIAKAMSNQLGVSIDREILMEEQKAISIDIEKERLRGNILRSVSHDLKTPLTGISGSVALIVQEQGLDEITKRELLNNIKENSDWLIKSIDNILSITRIDDEGLNLDKNMEVLEEIIEEVLSLRERELIDIDLKVEMPKDPIFINVDANLIKKVLLNILDNSIQHTKEGTNIYFNIRLSGKDVEILIEDDGGGIEDSNLELIFQRFFTALDSNKSSKDIKGVGLGLSISRSIVEAHNGSIEVYNNEIGGATFKIKIPIGGESFEKENINS